MLNLLSEKEKENLFLFLEAKKQMATMWRERVESTFAMEQYENDKIRYLAQTVQPAEGEEAPSMQSFVDKLAKLITPQLHGNAESGDVGDTAGEQLQPEDVDELMRLFIELSIKNRESEKVLKEEKVKFELLLREKESELHQLHRQSRALVTRPSTAKPSRLGFGNSEQQRVSELEKDQAYYQLTNKKLKVKVRKLLKQNDALRVKTAGIEKQHDNMKQYLRDHSRNATPVVPVRVSLPMNVQALQKATYPVTPMRVQNFSSVSPVLTQADTPAATAQLDSPGLNSSVPMFNFSMMDEDEPQVVEASGQKQPTATSLKYDYDEPPVFQRTPHRKKNHY
jgi:hypothetical protein